MPAEFPSRRLTETLTRPYGQNGQLKLLGRGNEHVVFRASIPYREIDLGREEVGSTHFVLKVSTLGMTSYHTPGILVFKFPGSRSLTEEDFITETTLRKERFSRLQRYFGNHALSEGSYMQQLLIDPDEFKKLVLHAETVPSGLSLINVFVRAQTLVPELDPETPQNKKHNTEILTLPYAEKNIIDPKMYTRANMRWIMLQDETAPFTEEDEVAINNVQQSESLAFMLQVAQGKSDKALQGALKDFVSSTIDYSSDTREILALRGKDNILFLGNGQWDYKLIDVLNPVFVPMLDNLTLALQKLASSLPLQEQDTVALHNGLGYVRSINALAQALGLSKRIRLQVDNFDPSLWGQVYSLLHNNTSFWEKVRNPVSVS